MSRRRLTHQNGTLALTFDDGPDPGTTPAILELLREHSVPAAFFMIGQKALAHPELVREVHRAGHIIGNHSFSHRPGVAIFKNALLWEIAQTQRVLETIIQKTPNFYRPPRGLLLPWLKPTVRRAGLELIYWSRMPGDYWFWHSQKWIQKKILNKIRGGDILILHDGLNLKIPADRENTLQALRQTLPLLKKKFTLVPLDEGLGLPAYRS